MKSAQNERILRSLIQEHSGTMKNSTRTVSSQLGEYPKVVTVSTLFAVPCESMVLGICSIRRSLLTELPQVVIKREKICKKVVCLPFNMESQFALIPVHHIDE